MCAWWMASATSAMIWASRVGSTLVCQKQFFQVRTCNVLEHDEAVRAALLLKVCVVLRNDEFLDLDDARVVDTRSVVALSRPATSYAAGSTGRRVERP